jgi:hypothetical protein
MNLSYRKTPNQMNSQSRGDKGTASDNETVQTKKSNVNPGIRNTRVQSQVPTRNFFPHLRTQMEFKTTKETPTALRTVNSSKYHQDRQAGRLQFY